jgi:hypothetical protein
LNNFLLSNCFLLDSDDIFFVKSHNLCLEKTVHLFTILLFACTGDNAVKTYNDTPVALITSHSDGFSLEEGVPVEFRAQVSDSNDPTEDLLSSWHMNNNLVCDWTAPDENGTSTCSITPTLDTNRVSVTVTDPEDAAGIHEISIQIFENTTVEGNDAPQVQISSPQNQAIYTEIEVIPFSAMVFDNQDSPDALTMIWSSSLSGIFNQDPANSDGFIDFDTTLSIGEHLITLTASDQDGAQTSDSLTVIVEENPLIPTFNCEITSPTSGSSFNLGSIISFEANARSDDDISLYAYQFSSDLDGVLYSDVIPGNGNISFSESNLSENMHQISLSLLDQENVVCEDNIFIEINPIVAPNGKLVFVSSQRHAGDFGGVIGADSFCQNLASIAGLSGTFKAWLSESTYVSSPVGRFIQSSIPYTLVDGTTIANDWSDLTDGSIQNPINIDEYGNASIASMVYSFTQIDGSPGLFGSSTSSCYGDDCNCNNWTNPNGQGSPTPGSAVGQTGITTDDWTDYSFGNFCGPSGYPVYCFEQ